MFCCSHNIKEMKELCGGGGKTNYIDWSCMCHKTLSLIEEWKRFGSTTLHTTTIDMHIVGSNQLEVWKQSENASSTTSQNFVKAFNKSDISNEDTLQKTLELYKSKHITQSLTPTLSPTPMMLPLPASTHWPTYASNNTNKI